MASQVDTSKWFELTEDSDSESDDDHQPKHHVACHSVDCDYDPKTSLCLSDPTLSQQTLERSQLFDSFGDKSKHSRVWDPTLSQYTLGKSQLSMSSSNQDKMDTTDCKKVDVESLNLQFQTLLADDSQDDESTQLSSASDQQLGSSMDDPWKSTTEASEGASLSEYPLESLRLCLDDMGQSDTKDSSGCEEVVNTAISEVSKNFITGNLSSYPLQCGDSDLSSDDQKVHQKSMEGKYPETAFGMSDSDWVTESDTNVSPRMEKSKTTESTFNSMSSFSPPLSSTVLTNMSVASAAHNHGLSVIQEASVDNTASFKEMPKDLSTVATSRGSFLGRDHETKYLDSINTKQSLSVPSLDSVKYGQVLKDHMNEILQDGGSRSQAAGAGCAAEFLSKSAERFDDKSLSSTSVSAKFKSSDAVLRTEGAVSSVDDGQLQYDLAHVEAPRMGLSQDRVRYGLDNLPSTVDLARKSEMILDKTLSKLNLGGPGEGRHSFPLSGHGSVAGGDYKRHSLGRLESNLYTAPKPLSRQEELVKTLSGSTQSYQSDDLTRSIKSLSSEASSSSASDEVARLMARSGSSAETTMSRGDESDAKDGCPESTKINVTHEGRRSEPSQEECDVESRVSKVLAETAYINTYSSAAYENRSSNYSTHSLPVPRENIQMTADNYSLPPPPPVDPQSVSSDLPLPPPPPPQGEELSASLDYRRLHQDLQEIQNSLQNNLDFADSGNESVQSNDVDREREARTPVGSETGSEIVPSTTNTPEQSRRLLWDYGADIACEGNQSGRFTSRDTDATETDSEDHPRSYVDRAQVAQNAAQRQSYNSEGEETHTSGSSNTKAEDAARAQGTDDEQTSTTGTPTNRSVDNILSSFRAQRSLIEAQYFSGMASQVSQILEGQDPHKQAHGILDQVNSQEQELLTRLANRPPLDSSFTDTSLNASSRSIVLTDSDVRKRLEMSGLSSPDRSRTFGHPSFTEFSTPKKINNPFAAFSNAKSFLSNQLQEMSNKTFDHSIELRTPLRRVVECYPLYGFSKDTEDKSARSDPAPSDSRTDTRQALSTESVHNRGGRGRPEGVSPEEFPSAPDLTSNTPSSHSLTERRLASSMERNVSERDVRADRPPSGTEYSQTPASVQRDSPESSPVDSDLSGGQRKDKLRPYRPTGSRDLYYTESDTGSLADSVTTMESTHTGSDDATAPYFPPHVLGTRGDGATQPPTSRKYQQPGIHMEPSLSTIEEKSVSDERDKVPMESSCTGLEKVECRDVRPERSLDQMRPLSPRDTFSKTSTRSALEMDSGVGTKSNFTTTTMTETLQMRERRNQVEPTEDGRRQMDSVDSGSRSDQVLKDGTYRATLKVLDTHDAQGSGSDRKIESRSQAQLDEERSRSGENLPWTSSGSQMEDIQAVLHSENPQGHIMEDRSQGQISDRRSGSGLNFGGTSSGCQIDDRRSALPSESRSRHSGVQSIGQYGNGRNVYDSHSGFTEATKSSDNVHSNGRQVSEQYVEYRSTVRDAPDHDYNNGRLRSRSDGDLIDRQPRSASAARDGQLPEPPASPIHPHSTLRDSTMRSDPRHSTAIDTSTDQRSGRGRFENNHIPMEEDQGQSSQGSSLRSGKDGRQRSDRKDTRQRMEQNRNSRRGHVDMSSSEDDGHRAIDRAPVSRPAQLLRETLEQEVDPSVSVDINILWQRFQELNQTDSDTSLNTTRMETLAQLLRNPAKHLVKSYFEDQEKQRKSREEKTSEEREKRRNQRRSQRNISESEINGSYSEVMEKGSPEKKAKTSSLRKMNKKNAGERTQEGVENLYSIPEDQSFDQRRYKKMDSLIDPNMEKLREKIRRQKEKIEREQRKELKRMEKLVKLEQLLSAKKKGKISESTLLDQLEYISTTSAPTDSMEDMTESTLTMSGANSEILTDDSTTAKDSSIEMQMIKFARNQPPSEKYDAGFGEFQQAVQTDIDKSGKSKKAEKVRTNQKLKEQSKNRGDKSKWSSKDKSVNETESLYDFREVDIQIQERPRHVDFSPDSNRRARSTSRGRTRDAATNYPSPLSHSPVSPQRQKQRRTKSEGIQTTPNLHRYSSKPRSPSPGRRAKQVQMNAPFAMREKTNRSQSPPYSRCFTPESMGTQHTRQKKKKLPANPKGIAWYVEVKDPRPWRQPLRERQEYAVKQAWVAPASKSQWQTAQPQDIMDEDEENQGYQETVVDRINQQDLQSKLIEEEYTFKKSQSLQDAFTQNMQKFISQSRERQKRMALAADHRRMQEELRLEREKIFPVQRKHGTNLDVHPYTEHLYQPKRRVFTRQEQKDHTQRIYKRLPEVMRREEDRKRENQYRLNRLKSKVFTKRVQRHILIKAGKY